MARNGDRPALNTLFKHCERDPETVHQIYPILFAKITSLTPPSPDAEGAFHNLEAIEVLERLHNVWNLLLAHSATDDALRESVFVRGMRETPNVRVWLRIAVRSLSNPADASHLSVQGIPIWSVLVCVMHRFADPDTETEDWIVEMLRALARWPETSPAWLIAASKLAEACSNLSDQNPMPNGAKIEFKERFRELEDRTSVLLSLVKTAGTVIRHLIHTKDPKLQDAGMLAFIHIIVLASSLAGFFTMFRPKNEPEASISDDLLESRIIPVVVSEVVRIILVSPLSHRKHGLVVAHFHPLWIRICTELSMVIARAPPPLAIALLAQAIHANILVLLRRALLAGQCPCGSNRCFWAVSEPDGETRESGELRRWQLYDTTMLLLKIMAQPRLISSFRLCRELKKAMRRMRTLDPDFLPGHGKNVTMLAYQSDESLGAELGLDGYSTWRLRMETTVRMRLDHAWCFALCDNLEVLFSSIRRRSKIDQTTRLQCRRRLLSVQVKKCGACMQAFYCSEDCARRAWTSEHAETCPSSLQAFGRPTLLRMGSTVDASFTGLAPLTPADEAFMLVMRQVDERELFKGVSIELDPAGMLALERRHSVDHSNCESFPVVVTERTTEPGGTEAARGAGQGQVQVHPDDSTVEMLGPEAFSHVPLHSILENIAPF